MKLKKKYISFCEDKNLVVKIDIVIFLSYFVEREYSLTLCLKVFTLVQRSTSFGKLFQTDGAKKEMQC